MKTFKTTCDQGELTFRRLPDDFKVPADAVLLAREGGKVIVGHSETGHHHVLERPTTKHYESATMGMLKTLLVVSEEDVLRHLREDHTHESIAFVPGNYEVTRLREHNPFTEAFQASAD